MQEVDYTIKDGTSRLIKVRAKEESFSRVIRVRVDIDGKVTWKRRGFAKLAESMDDIDAMEKVICDVLTETTGLTKEQLGEVPLVLADGAMWCGGEVTIGTIE